MMAALKSLTENSNICVISTSMLLSFVFLHSSWGYPGFWYKWSFIVYCTFWVLCCEALDYISFYEYIVFCLFISWEEIQLFFWLLQNNAAMNIHVQVFVWMYVFTSCDYMLKIWIARLYDSSIFNILRNYKTIPTLAVPFNILTCSVWGFQFLYILIKTCFFFLL